MNPEQVKEAARILNNIAKIEGQVHALKTPKYYSVKVAIVDRMGGLDEGPVCQLMLSQELQEQVASVLIADLERRIATHRAALQKLGVQEMDQ